MSKIIPTEEKRRSADIVNNAVKEVNDRFPDWQPTPTMLGYARAVASAAAEAFASHALAARIEAREEAAKVCEDHIEAGTYDCGPGLDLAAKTIRTLPTTIAGGQ